MGQHALFFNPPIEENWLGHQVAEIYKDKIYDPLLRGKKDLIILEIGANIGVASYFFSQFAKQVYALEPSLQHFEVLETMLKFNGITNVKPIRKAIYIENGVFPFGGPTGNKTMRSLHTATWEGGRSDENVEAVTLEKLFEDEKIEHVDFMKLDIEGSEAEVLAHTSFKAVAPKIDTILMELHSWTGRHPNQVRDALKNAGYELMGVPNDAEIIIARRINV